MEKRASRLTSVLKFSLAFVLVALGAILVNKNTGKQESLSAYTFANEPVEVRGFSSEDVPEEKLPRRIIIPQLGIDLEIGRSQIVAGFWEVFPQKVGWGSGSGVPGETGNQVIFAHAREGLFLPLQATKRGMPIYVLTQEGWYQYQVEEIKEALPNQTEVITPTEDERLTLYTCSGFADTKRLIVVAKRVRAD